MADMIRKGLIHNGIGIEQDFRLRGKEIARIEGLSDAVFGFAVTLLIVSLEVPKTFNELMIVMRGFVPFAISFFLLILVWFHQYKFFRKYGLQDNTTVWLNVLLLFLVLFFVYPLKFLFTLVFAPYVGLHRSVELADGRAEPAILHYQVPALMTIYGLGFAAVFAIFALLNYHAYRKRRELGLTPVEEFDTRTSINESMISGGVALLSVALAHLVKPEAAGLAGFAFFLLGPALGIHGNLRGRHRRKHYTETTAQ